MNSEFNNDRVFNVKEASEVDTEGMELRYEVEHREEGDPNYLRQRVYRDKDGNYYLAMKSGTTATAMLSSEVWYHPDGREVLIPVRPEALAIWAKHNLHGEEYERALAEFRLPENVRHKTVWRYQQGAEVGQQGYVYEFLWKTDDGFYMLFSTDCDYPCPGYNSPFIDLDEDGTCRDDLYIYYVTPETARRWAEARGMGEVVCREAFGDCAA